MGHSAVVDNRKADRRLIMCYLEDARRAQTAAREADADFATSTADRSGTDAACSEGLLFAGVAGSGDLDAARLKKLVEPHLFYVFQVAREFQGRDVPFEELLAEGNIGLVEAARRYDASHETKFLTYASWWIRKRILDYLAREARCVRLTRYARDRRRSLKAIEDKLRSDLGRDPSTEELAEASGLKPRTVRDIGAGTVRVFSLDQPRNGSEFGPSLTDSLADVRAASPFEAIEQRSARDQVRRELSRLPERERFVLESRFGLDGRQPMTFEEIGRVFGVSRERARQIEQEALRKLRRRMASGRPGSDRSATTGRLRD